MRRNLAKIKNDTKRKEYRRKLSIRKKVIGTLESPRLCVSKTNKHLRIQAINDLNSVTIFSIQTYGKNKIDAGANIEGAKLVGAQVAKQLKVSGYSRAVFDRGGKQYTGVIKSIADSIRENGITI